MKINLSSETVKLEGTFTTQDVFSQAMIDIISSGGNITQEKKTSYFSKNGFLVSLVGKSKERDRRAVPLFVMLEIIKKGIEEGRDKIIRPFNLASDTIEWMMCALCAKNRHQLAKHLDIEVTTPSAWEKAQYVPLKHIERAMEISILINKGAEVISRLTYTDVMIAKAIGITPGAIVIMKKDQPKKYDLLACGIKLKIAKGVESASPQCPVDHSNKQPL